MKKCASSYHCNTLEVLDICICNLTSCGNFAVLLVDLQFSVFDISISSIHSTTCTSSWEIDCCLELVKVYIIENLIGPRKQLDLKIFKGKSALNFTWLKVKIIAIAD